MVVISIAATVMFVISSMAAVLRYKNGETTAEYDQQYADYY
jgi:hypothetical protein